MNPATTARADSSGPVATLLDAAAQLRAQPGGSAAGSAPLHDRLEHLSTHGADTIVCHLVRLAGEEDVAQPDALQALLRAVLAGEVARRLGWPADLARSLRCAALQLGTDRADPTADPTAAQALERLPRPDPETLALAALPAADRLARVLRRIDLLVRRLAGRSGEAALGADEAARRARVDGHGRPDEIGAALQAAIGHYPPGSYVELANGEAGIVIARGTRANMPIVAALRSGEGAPLAEPMLRNTAMQRFAVRSGLAGALRGTPPQERLAHLLRPAG